MTLDQLESFVAACKDDGVQPDQEIAILMKSGAIKVIEGATTYHPLVRKPCIKVK